MDSRDPVVVFFEKSVIQSITLLRKWDLWGSRLISRETTYLVRYLSRSILGALSEAKFFNFFRDEIYDQIIGGIT